MEESPDWEFFDSYSDSSDGPELTKKHYHLLLLADDGYVVQVGECFFRMTSAGHDFVSATRDNVVWAKVKSAGSAVGGATLKLLGQIALGYVKKTAEDLGIPLG